jgi:anti-anti-sigma factor
MTLEMTTLPDVTIVMIPQRFDANNAPVFESELRTLLAHPPKKIILDFSATEYIASAGLRVLLSFSRDFMKAGGRIALVELRQTVRKVFELAGFTSIFLICISREEAIQKMK